MSRIRVLWNPTAGTKAGLPTNAMTEPRLRELMAEHGLGDDLVIPASKEEAIDAARAAAAEGIDIVVAAGGDGTVGTVAFELLGSASALGILPLGSAMNVARSLDIPRDAAAAADVIAAGHIRAIDVAIANGRPFLEIGSVGINAAIFGEAHRFDQGHYGSFIGLLRTILRYQPVRIRLTLDDRRITTRALMVAVANAPYTGLGFTIAPDASLDDGRLDVRVFDHFSKWELLRHLGSIALGRRAYSPKVRTYRSRRVLVEARHPRPARADAMDLGTTPVEFTIRPGALPVVSPPSSPRP
jgi:YegS/Rv2252/BmrU family lipid kinase